MNDNTDTDAENFDAIPGMPSAESIRTELLKTGGPQYWRPHGVPDGTATDFAALGEAGKKALQARLQLGPGQHGTPWQHEVHAHYQRLAELDREQARIEAKLDEVKGYDPETGKPIKALPPSERKALGYALAQVVDERVRAEDGHALDKKLEAAVKAEQRRLKQAYILSEAKRRATARATEDEIDRLAANFAKTLPKP